MLNQNPEIKVIKKEFKIYHNELIPEWIINVNNATINIKYGQILCSCSHNKWCSHKTVFVSNIIRNIRLQRIIGKSSNVSLYNLTNKKLDQLINNYTTNEQLNEKKECSICLDLTNTRSSYKCSICNNHFHLNCIYKLKKMSCPLCRSNLTNEY